MSSTPTPGSRPYITRLRARLLAVGFDDERLAEQIVQDLVQNRMRPREAWRLVCELSLDAVAIRFNAIRRDDPASMRKGRVWDFEQWPRAGVRPTVPTLRVLAQIYGTTWDRLVDLDDLAQMPGRRPPGSERRYASRRGC